MKIRGNDGGDFQPCPEYTGQAVCVDVTPLKMMHSQYGDKEVFKLVFEVDETREDGGRFAVWSRPFTASLFETANLRKFLRSWFGRELTAQEMEEFETEDLIGKGAHVVIDQQEGENGNTYSNIVVIKPDKGKTPLKPSGDFVRKKDREDKPEGESQGSGSRYARSEQPKEDAGRDDWMKTKVHVGTHAGVELGDLDEDAVNALIEKWLPIFKEMEKPKVADKRLAAALVEAQKTLVAYGVMEQAGEEESPY